MFVLLYALAASAREIMIEPKSSLVFMEDVSSGKVHKFVYSSDTPVHVSITDPLERNIVEMTNKSSTVYTEIATAGRLKTAIQNLSDSRCNFVYMCPDVSKEIAGNVGYVKDTDIVAELARSLDDLIAGQQKLVNRTLEHQKMVAKTRFWANLLMIFEFLLTAFMVYMLHKDFVGMFEKKQTL
ncbi:hypothetical protein PAPHI01_2172 [Pancytospora philotis]|nr:hypothetical protein PAPHI01_2172 [Pancytospora philotis]